MKKILSILTMTLLLSWQSAFAMPNPVMEYSSQTLAEQAVGFEGLTPGLKTGFTLQRAFVIGNELLELVYTDANNRKLTLRTAEFTGPNEDISGIYGAQWYEWGAGSLHMHMANLDNNKSASYWHDKNYSYAMIGENVVPREFQELAAAAYMSIHPENPARPVDPSLEQISAAEAVKIAGEKVPSTASFDKVKEGKDKYTVLYKDNDAQLHYTAIVDIYTGKVEQLQIISNNAIGSDVVEKTVDDIKAIILAKYPDAANVQVNLFKEYDKSVYVASFTTNNCHHVLMKFNPLTGDIFWEDWHFGK